MYRKITFLISFCLIICVAQSQTQERSTLSLNDCIGIAIKNNLNLKITELRAKSSKINYSQSKANLLPNLNINYNLGVTNGRSIDPFTNDYINQELIFSNAGLSLNTTVFNGFKLLNSIKQNRFNLQASEMEIEEAKQNLTLEVILLYIQILSNRDLLELSKSRLETTKKQLKRLEIYYKEGIGNPADYTDMLGQHSIDQIAIINTEQNFNAVISVLTKLLNIEPHSEFTFEDSFTFVESQKFESSANDVYNDALQNLATFKAKQYRIDAANSGIKVAKSNYSPEISLFGQLNTNYSSAAQVFTSTGTVINETGDFVTIDNQEYPVLRNENIFEEHDISYNDQFDNNLNSVVGLSVRIPLFNGFQTKNNVNLRKIELEESLIDLQNTKLNFKNSIKLAHNNMNSAYNKYQVLLDQVTAFEESFRVNEVRFNNGVSNIVEYITSKNNLDSAKLNLLNAKYEYILRVRILEYYRGDK